MNKLFQVITCSAEAPGFAGNASHDAPLQDNRKGISRVIIKDLQIDMLIGIYDFEQKKKQPVIINVEMEVDRSRMDWMADDIEQTVNYAEVIEGIKAIAADGHINLVELFAEKIADLCLQDKRVIQAQVSVSKPDIIPEAGGVGVEIIRQQTR